MFSLKVKKLTQRLKSLIILKTYTQDVIRRKVWRSSGKESLHSKKKSSIREHLDV